ncbi:unnamed protein product [Echinostoma caproni]|uniref:G_PROTEIN_RECEP_F1_2 domain-containing protein n=1 Tax=Echinostoma caproni TaxID=27848 RepID=A0A183AYL6_9TREM|nr:unnamed protein product [Echinostoma caproni]
MEIARRRYLRLQNLSTKLTPQGNVSRCVPETKIELISQKAVPAEYGPFDPDQATEERKNGRKRTDNAVRAKGARTGHRESIQSGEAQTSNRLGKKTRQSQRATIMLIVVVVSFVITEAPQGVFNTLVAVKGECFHSTVYVPLGDVLDLAVLLNSSINFILYCTMSQMFRANFARLIYKICPCLCTRLIRVSSVHSRTAANSVIPQSHKNPLVIAPNTCDQINHRLVPFRQITSEQPRQPDVNASVRTVKPV